MKKLCHILFRQGAKVFATLLTLTACASNPLWNGSGSITNNNFSNTNNWVAGSVPSGNSVNNVPIGFGPLANGATNTANCDASGNSQTWTFNTNTAPMVVTLNGQQLGAATGPDVFVNNSTNLQTIVGTFSLFDINGNTSSRRFTAAAGPLAIAASLIKIRGDSSPTTWAIEFGGAANGTFNSAFTNMNDTGTLNYLMSGSGTWEIISALPNLTANPSALTVNAGTLTLDAANTYSGPTFIATGATLYTVTTATGSGSFTVSNNATLGVTLVSARTSLTNSSLTLGLTGGDATALNLNFCSFGNPTYPLVSVTGVLNLNGVCIINVSNGAFVAGHFPLIKYGSQTGSGNFILGALPPGVTASLSNNLANSSIDLVVTANLGWNNVIYWDGSISGVWDITNAANWKLGTATGLTYSDTNQVVFDDTASGNFAVTLNEVVNPLSLTVSNSVNNFSITGTGGVGGQTALNKFGRGVLTVSTSNSYSGQTVVNSGAMILNSLGAVPSVSSLNIASGAVVQPNLAGTYIDVPTTLNGFSTVNGSSGGSLDFHSGGATTVTWPGAINLNTANATIGSYGVTYNVTLAGRLTGSGGLTLRPEGGSKVSHTATFTLSNPTNNYAGTTTMQVGTAQVNATLKLGVNNALPPTTTLNLNRVGSSGVVYFDLGGYGQTLCGLTANFDSNAVINSSGSAGTLTVSNDASDNFYGDLGVVGKANFSFKKLGGGMLTIGGPNYFSGTMTVGSGTLMVTGLVAATSGLVVSNNATLQVSLGGSGNATNIWVNGDVTLAGQLNVNDSGIVSNTVYPIIYYSGTLNTNGLTVAPLAPWAFTIDVSVPHLVRLIPTQQFPLAQFTNGNFAVTTLTTNLGGILRGLPQGPIWYEVRDQTNRLWDYGATPAVSPWSITIRHLRSGTNSVTVFAQDSLGNIQSNRVQLSLTLGANPPVRPRPQPAEIWWGGSCHDNLYDANTNIIGTYSRLSQLMQTNGWDFVKRYTDGFLLHGYVWVNAVARMTNWQAVGASISAQFAPFNGKYWLEDVWQPPTNNLNFGHSSASSQVAHAGDLLGVGFALTEICEDFNPNYKGFSAWHPDWPTNDIRVVVTGNTNQATPSYPYASGLWRDYANDFSVARPDIKFGWTWSPVWFHWLTGPSLGTDDGIFTISSNGTNYSFNWDFYDYMNDAMAIGNQTGVPFAFSSDCPWDYYGKNPGNPGGWSLAHQSDNRVKIRNYEAWLQNRNLRHTMICNYSQMNAADTNASDLTYETNSLSTLYLHQQEGGRATRYSFESWYQGPYTLLPETKPGSYTHLALSAIKYLKGIADTNGNLESLTLTSTATSGTVVQIQLQNNGDVQCLPALAGQAGNVPGVITRYFATNGSELTATMLTAEGLCYTNLLPPGAKTNLFAVTLASNLSLTTNGNASLEAFWNPQDPLGIVRDREIFSPSVNPLGLWCDADIGDAVIAGGSALSGTNFTLLGSGADIWGTADTFHFLYQTNSGDGTITARVASQTAADIWSKAGVMIRETSSTNAKNVFVCVTPNNGVSFQNRAATGGASFSNNLTGMTAPYWVRLTRSGGTFTAFCSSNGVNWVTVGSSNLTGFAASALWGLGVTAHNNALASAATFDNVTLPDVPPTLTPIANRTITAGQSLTVTNSATDPNSPPQTLKFGLDTWPAGMTLNATNGLLTWRPTVSQSPTTNPVTLVVTDNGQPPLSATQAFTVVVLRPTSPSLTLPGLTNGVFTLRVVGDSGPDYIMQGTTNLNPPVVWLPMQTNVSAVPPFIFTDPVTNSGSKFYRVQLAP